MTLRSTCAIVLKVADHGESDELVTCYSRELGRITGLAKGAKRSARRFVNKLEEFSLLQLLCRPPRSASGLYFIGEAELLRAHLSLRTVYPRYVAAAFLCELTLRFTRDNDPDQRIFALLQWALDALDRGEAVAKTAALFHLLLLDAAGYRPELLRVWPLRPGRRPGPELPAAPGQRIAALQRLPAEPRRPGQPAVGADPEVSRPGPTRRSGATQSTADAGPRRRRSPRGPAPLHPVPAAAGHPLLEEPARPRRRVVCPAPGCVPRAWHGKCLKTGEPLPPAVCRAGDKALDAPGELL